MSDFDEAYERTVAKVLSEHLERGVPEGTDLWPAVQKRLAEREGAVEPPREHRWFDWLLGVASPQDQTDTPTRRSQRRAYRYAQLAAGLVGLLLLAAVTTLVISRLAARPDKNQVLSNTTAIPSTSADDDKTLLFTVPVGKDGVHITGPNDLAGLAVADDGSFWIGDAANRLLHYSPSGELIKTIDLSTRMNGIYDIDIWGSNIWVLNKTIGLLTVYKVAPDGRVLGEYLMPDKVAGSPPIQLFPYPFLGLRMGGAGEVLIENVPDSSYVQVSDSLGNLSRIVLTGYPAGGKVYKIDEPPPKFVMAGDVLVPIRTEDRVRNAHMLRVQPDGSFYVLVEGIDPAQVVNPINYTYIMHYSSDGRLIERARALPSENLYGPEESRRLASGSDGSFYRLTELHDTVTQVTHLGVYRIRFYPAGEPLPPTPVPTATPLQLPTPVPTEAPKEVPVYTATNVVPTPIADLATLVNRASYIARVKLAPARNRIPYGLSFDLEPTQWFKPAGGITTTAQPGTAPVPVATVEWFMPASGVMTGNLRLDISFGNYGVHRYPDTLKDQSVNDYILFFNQNGSYAPNIARYELADVMAGVFAIRDGKISYAGIGKYNGLPVENLEQDIRALLTPTAANKDLPPISLGLEGEGLRLQAPGGFGPVDWLDSSNLLVQLAGPAPSPQAGSGQALTTGVYLLDLTYTRTLRPVALGASAFLPVEVFPDRIGYHAALVGTDPGTGRPLELSVLDVRTGEAQTVYSSKPASTQWVTASQRAAFRNISEVSITWVGQDTFVATLMPVVETGTDTNTLQKLGKLVLVDIGKRSVQVVAERGRVAATLLDGSLVVQNDWIDGELQLFEAPYTGQPRTIAPKGPWRVGWGVADGGVQSQVVQKLAWLEMAPPPGDWSKRLPQECCSGDPAPKVQAIVVWDRPTGQIERFPVSNYGWSTPDVGWSQDEKLRWSTDWSNPSLFYAAHPGPNDLSTRLYRLGMDGKSTLLAKQEPYGTIKLVGEGNDGLYYEILGYTGQQMVQLMRLSRDGKLSVERANAPAGEWVIDEEERLLSRLDAGVSVKDLKGGATWQIAVPGEPLTSDRLRDAAIDGLITLSPGTGQWAIYRNPLESENGPVQVVHIIKSR